MSSTDLSTTILWQTLSKDVYSYGKYEDSKNNPTPIMEVSEELESQPLLEKGVRQKKKVKGASWLTASFLIVNTALGIGLLNFPAAYNQAGGIYFATGIQIFMVVLMMSTMLILAYCSDVNGDQTYHDVLLSMCGKKGQQLAAVSIALTLYCVCVASLIIIGDQMDSLFHTIFGPHFCDKWYLDRRFTIAATSVLFIFPTCFCKRVDFLGHIGTVGIFAMVYPVFLTVYGYYTLKVKPPILKTRPDDITTMLAMLPVLGLGYQYNNQEINFSSVSYACQLDFLVPPSTQVQCVFHYCLLFTNYCDQYNNQEINFSSVSYACQLDFLVPPSTQVQCVFHYCLLFTNYCDQCQEVVVPVYSCMRDRNLCNFVRSSILSMSFLFILYSIIGCFGYLTFGSAVAHNIMKMYDASDPFVSVGVGALIIKMIVTYPILALCGRDAASGIYAELRGLKPAEFLATERIRRYICASIWFGSSLLLAISTSGIGIVIKYLGSVASANIFIYPGICLIKVMLKRDPTLKETKSRFLVCYGIFIAALGAFCFGVVLFQAILSKEEEPPTELCVPTK